MTSITTQETILPTGKGIIVDRFSGKELLGHSPDDVKELLRQYGFIVFKNIEYSEEEIVQFAAQLGKIVTYDDERESVNYNKGPDPIFYVDGDTAPEKILCSTGALPLHTEGLVLGNKVDALILYAAAINRLNGGETTVCDAKTAIQEMPADLYQLVQENGCEFTALEKGYFSVADNGYYSAIDTVHELDGDEFWQISMNFPEGARAAWAGKIAGMTVEESKPYMDRLRLHFSHPRYTYRQRWETYDLLLADNKFCYHGREAYVGSRLLYNINIDFPEVVWNTVRNQVRQKAIHQAA